MQVLKMEARIRNLYKEGSPSLLCWLTRSVSLSSDYGLVYVLPCCLSLRWLGSLKSVRGL